MASFVGHNLIASTKKTRPRIGRIRTNVFRVITENGGKFVRAYRGLSRKAMGSYIIVYESNDSAPIHQAEELVAIQDINPGLLRRFAPLQPQSKFAANLQRKRTAYQRVADPRQGFSIRRRCTLPLTK